MSTRVMRNNTTSLWKRGRRVKFNVKGEGHLWNQEDQGRLRRVQQQVDDNEDLAKPILTRMIKGEDIELDRVFQEIVARWVAMKVIVAEYALPDVAVTPPADRLELKERGQIPPYFNIYAARHSAGVPTWFMRNSCTFARDFSGPIPPLDGMGNNVQQVTLIIGALAIHVNAARLDGWRTEDELKPALHAGIRIWPIEREIFEWSTSRCLGAQSIGNLANSLDVLIVQPRVVWAPGATRV